MSKNAKLLIGLTAVALLIVLYFIFSSRSLTIEDTGGERRIVRTDGSVETAAPVDLAALESEYKAEIKMIITEFETLASPGENDQTAVRSDAEPAPATDLASGTSALRVAKLRDQLMGVTVPNQFKDLHLELVFAFNKMEEYFLNRVISDREASLEFLSRAKNENDWLN
ncbi:MAG: hypothetical protein MUC28_04075 [Planctomycetes bacterium]|jgi:hypothetical protein|nr:hypothetical protein [Planctomycetota bacterium]